MRSRLWTLTLVFLLSGVFPVGRAQAGLIMTIDPSIKVDQVSTLSINRGNLEIGLIAGGKKVIELPPGALEHIAAWAANPAEGPMIVSMDGSFVSSGKNYIPAGVTRELGDALFYYDVFAHQLALGYVPENQQTHPLVIRSGASALPGGQYKALIDAKNKSERALWYRSLAEHYEYPIINPIGEFTLRAKPSGEDYPIRLEVESWLTFYPPLWYAPIFVPSAWENTAAMLPYAPLQKDMEQNWADYRKAFRQMGELSSVVEAYALLKVVKRDNDALWTKFRGSLNELSTIQYEGARLQKPGWRSEQDTLVDWITLCRISCGRHIETTQQANMALALMGTYNWSKKFEPGVDIAWRKEVVDLAKDNSSLRAKVALSDCLRADPGSDEMVDSIDRFLKIARPEPDLFRLRVQGLHSLDGLAPKLSAHVKEILQKEHRAALDDFHKQVADAPRTDPPDLFVWENLIQNVYSTDLVNDAKTTLSDDDFLGFLRDLATVHFQRGMAPQVGRELTVTHAHYRFLGYIADEAKKKNASDDLLDQIRTWRGGLAAKMGLKEGKS